MASHARHYGGEYRRPAHPRMQAFPIVHRNALGFAERRLTGGVTGYLDQP